jgi:vacuolar-type H+-ATPase subunit H
MSTGNRPPMNTDAQSLQFTNGLDEDGFAFLSSLIEQNAQLMQQLEELRSGQKLENRNLSDSNRNRIEAEANARAAAIISEADTKAKLESGRIMKEAKDTALLRDREASDRAANLIREAESKAKIEADRIVAEAKETGDTIIKEKTQTAIKHGLLIIEKAKEKALSILNEANSEAKAIRQKVKSKG